MDGNTQYTKNENNDQMIKTIKEIFIPLLKWFKDNKIKISPNGVKPKF